VSAQHFSPLARWAERRPAVRWPLVLVLVFLLWGLAGWLDHAPLP